MIRNTTKRQKLGWVLFILYLCLLAYFMFFSESFGRTDTSRGYQYNLVPFKEISRYFRYYSTIGPLLFRFSLMLETLQLIFMVGSFDVDDMQLNTLGAALGYLAYRFVQWARVSIRRRRLMK